jgi:hypothetical protein
MLKTYIEFMSEKTLFLPELVKVFSVPASLWREIQILPFAIERISSTAKLSRFRETLQTRFSPQKFSDQVFAPAASAKADKFTHLVIFC